MDDMEARQMSQTHALGAAAQLPAHWRTGNALLALNKRVAFYYIYIAFTLGAAATLLIPQSEEGKGSNVVFAAAWIAMHLVSAAVFLGFRTHRKSDLFIVATIGAYIVGSAAWSASPKDTIVYGTMAAGNIATAYMIARDLTPREIMLMCGRVILALAILGTILGLIGYSQALYFDSHGRPTIVGTHPIRGFFNHKITASLYATIGAIACLACYKGAKRILSISCLGLFVVLTGSSTGLVLFPAGLALFLLLNFIRRVRGERAAQGVALFGVIVAALIVGILSANIEAILASLGRDPTLTGRTLLWEWGVKTWLQRPVLGWGFNGYFNGPDAKAISEAIKSFENYNVPHFHQSYIQTAVDLGIPGIVALLGIQISIVSRAWTLMRTRDTQTGAEFLTILSVSIIAALTMFVFITYNHFVTLIMFAIYFSLRQNRAFSGYAEAHYAK